MLERPRLRSSFHIIATAAPGVLFLLDEQRQVILEGETFVRLAPLLDGSRSVAELAREAAPASLPEVLGALAALERRDCLLDGGSSLPGGRRAFLEALPGAAPKKAGSGARIGIRSLTGKDEQSFAALALEAGLELAPASEPADLSVVLTDDYLRAELAAVNAEQLRARRPWLIVKADGLVPWIGPILVPGQTGCWECLAQRLRANRQMESYILARSGEPGLLVRARPALEATRQAALAFAVIELARQLLLDGGDALVGRMLSLDLLTHTVDSHALVRRPQCRACGEPGAPRPPGPVVLSPCPKRYRADGGHRTLTPAETFARHRHHVSPILGAVTELRPALGRHDSELTPTFVAGHNFSMGIDSVVFLRESVRGMSGGKGASRIQAMVSGLCEALERYSGLHTGEDYVVRGSYQELAPAAIHPNQCMGFSAEQYRGREAWNRSQPASRCVMVPREFDVTAPLDWSPLWSLTHERQRLLPAAYCYYGHPEFAGRWCIPDSNGCAAGNTLEEALLQALFELVERDAVAIWWYNRTRRRGLDLDSFELPYVTAIRAHYASMGRSLHVLDISSDLPVTTLACVSSRQTGPTEDVLVGFGAHFDPRVALLRAITEVNQFLPSVGQQRPDGTTLYLFGDELARRWWTSARLAELPYLLPAEDVASARADDFEDLSSDDIAQDVARCVAAIQALGLEVLAQDLTRPDIGLHVVRVVAPGLCHFWRRLGFPRLYEVPVKMSWRASPASPEALNPDTVFF